MMWNIFYLIFISLLFNAFFLLSMQEENKIQNNCPMNVEQIATRFCLKVNSTTDYYIRSFQQLSNTIQEILQTSSISPQTEEKTELKVSLSTLKELEDKLTSCRGDSSFVCYLYKNESKMFNTLRGAVWQMLLNAQDAINIFQKKNKISLRKLIGQGAVIDRQVQYITLTRTEDKKSHKDLIEVVKEWNSSSGEVENNENDMKCMSSAVVAAGNYVLNLLRDPCMKQIVIHNNRETELKNLVNVLEINQKKDPFPMSQIVLNTHNLLAIISDLGIDITQAYESLKKGESRSLTEEQYDIFLESIGEVSLCCFLMRLESIVFNSIKINNLVKECVKKSIKREHGSSADSHEGSEAPAVLVFVGNSKTLTDRMSLKKNKEV